MKRLRILSVVAAIAAAAVVPTIAQQPELPRTVDARPHLGIRIVNDGAVKVNRDFYRATPMAILLAGAMQAEPPIVTVVGTGQLILDVDVATLAECSAQGYRVYVGAPATAQRVNLNATCTGTARPFQATSAIADFRSLLASTARTIAATAFVAAADGELESSRTTAPFVLRLGAPPVAPTFPATGAIQPRR